MPSGKYPVGPARDLMAKLATDEWLTVERLSQRLGVAQDVLEVKLQTLKRQGLVESRRRAGRDQWRATPAGREKL